MEPRTEKKEFQNVYAIAERKDGKERWVRLGAAFTNRDGSLTVLLDAVPTNGKLVIRERSEEERRGAFGKLRVHGREGIAGPGQRGAR